jgi:general nucleoside transport system permease protein
MAWHLQRFPTTTPAVALAARAGAIILALVVSGVIVSFHGADPLQLGAQVIRSTFGSRFGLQDFGLLVTPLILCGLAVAVTLRIGIWNIGAEGQFAMGAFATTAVGVFVAGPPPVMLVVLFLAGALGGLLWILLPTLARAYVGVNELITTLLLNFVAALAVYYVSTGPWRDKASGMTASTFKVPYVVPPLWGTLHYGIVVAIILAVLLAGVLNYTRWGYEVRLSGANPDAARYAGIPVRRRIVAVMLISGAIAGLAGMFEIAGTVHRLQGGISNNFGYVGIMVAILARGSCLGVIAAAVLMAVILNAGIVLQTKGITVNTVLALTGLILFFTAISDELAHYRRAAPPAKPA